MNKTEAKPQLNTRSLEKAAVKFVISASETRLGHRLLTNDVSRGALVAARKALRARYERSIPVGRIEQWTPDSLAESAIERGSMQKPKELARLIEIIEESQPQNILEIGTGLGGTVFALCHAAPVDARITTVTMQGKKLDYGYSKSLAQKIKTYAADNQTLNLLKGDTHTPETRSQIVEAVGREPVDFLLIDGDHTLAGVRQDFEDYSSLVKPGGIIAFHDIISNPTTPKSQVSVFWEGLKSEYEGTVEEIVDTETPPWGGLGVITLTPEP